MMIPLQITFRDMEKSQAVAAQVRRRVNNLEKFYERIISCRVAISHPHRHKRQGQIFRIHIELKVPGADLVVVRDPEINHAHEDIFVSIRDAFAALQRQLQAYVRKLPGERPHPRITAPHAIVSRIIYTGNGDFGFLRTPDGREIYFHRNSVRLGNFDELRPGVEVRYSEETGEEGPQASTVEVVGREGRHLLKGQI